MAHLKAFTVPFTVQITEKNNFPKPEIFTQDFVLLNILGLKIKQTIRASWKAIY